MSKTHSPSDDAQEHAFAVIACALGGVVIIAGVAGYYLLHHLLRSPLILAFLRWCC